MVVNVYVEGGVINDNVNATTINNSEALREELNRFMQRALNRNDISIDLKYGKLRHAPGIIAHLNPTDLISKDNELKLFCERVQEVKPANRVSR